MPPTLVSSQRKLLLMRGWLEQSDEISMASSTMKSVKFCDDNWVRVVIVLQQTITVCGKILYFLQAMPCPYLSVNLASSKHKLWRSLFKVSFSNSLLLAPACLRINATDYTTKVINKTRTPKFEYLAGLATSPTRRTMEDPLRRGCQKCQNTTVAGAAHGINTGPDDPFFVSPSPEVTPLV
ncbi:uncharacterized protein [Macrobrachium rosenbergii]|uniref:uncharacterized protein n=1 Tax=Macrobrachium rosenbergii TaxID=79674 RepID=UPI0034D3FBF4